MNIPRVYADFQNADQQGRLRLTCAGTVEDLSKASVKLQEGLSLLLYTDDLDAHGQPLELLVEGLVTFSQDERCWVAIIDWNAIRRVSQRAESRPTVLTESPRAATPPTGAIPR